MSTPIPWDRLDTLARNTLLNNHCKTVEDIAEIGYVGLRETPNCGRVTLALIGAVTGVWPADYRGPSLSESVRLTILEKKIRALNTIIVQLREELDAKQRIIDGRAARARIWAAAA